MTPLYKVRKHAKIMLFMDARLEKQYKNMAWNAKLKPNLG